MKICSTCKQSKPYSAFHKLKSSSDGYTRRCKECQKAANAKHYYANKPAYLDSANRSRLKTTVVYQEFKNTLACVQCGEARSWCLSFHHLDPSKKDLSVSKLITHSWSKIQAEIQKCIVLCHNCHADEHYRLKHNA